jgi:hypothetical protein
MIRLLIYYFESLGHKYYVTGIFSVIFYVHTAEYWLLCASDAQNCVVIFVNVLKVRSQVTGHISHIQIAIYVCCKMVVILPSTVPSLAFIGIRM